MWFYLYSRYKVTLNPRLHWLDRPLEFYNADELRELVLRPFRAGRAWKIDNLNPSSQRNVSLGGTIGSIFEIIRGGRWLLWATEKGEVHYHDLDLPSSSDPRVLIRWPSNDGGEIHRMAVYMDIDTPYLTFQLAVLVHGSGRRLDKRKHTPLNTNGAKIFVWVIKAVPDDRGHVIDLKADILISSSDRSDGEVECLSFSKNMLAYSIRGERLTRFWEWGQEKRSRLKGRFAQRSFKVRETMIYKLRTCLTGPLEYCLTSQRMGCLSRCTWLPPSI